MFVEHVHKDNISGENGTTKRKFLRKLWSFCWLLDLCKKQKLTKKNYMRALLPFLWTGCNIFTLSAVEQLTKCLWHLNPMIRWNIIIFCSPRLNKTEPRRTEGESNNTRKLKQRRSWATDVNRKLNVPCVACSSLSSRAEKLLFQCLVACHYGCDGVRWGDEGNIQLPVAVRGSRTSALKFLTDFTRETDTRTKV